MGPTDAAEIPPSDPGAAVAANMSLFSGKHILAPMVRIGELPMRLLALSHGADLVYSPELIALKLMKCTRTFNEKHQTTDFVHQDAPYFRTCVAERPKVMLQLGAADPQSALDAARLVKDDVLGFDLNCGCPKHFSIQGGMGAALLRRKDVIVDILTALVSLGKPVTCKIRLLPDIERTLELVHSLQKTGICALTVHCRTPQMTYDTDGQRHLFREIYRILDIPLILNGDFRSVEEYRSFVSVLTTDSLPRAVPNCSMACMSDALSNLLLDENESKTGGANDAHGYTADRSRAMPSVMFARAAMQNASVFSGLSRSLDEISKEYICFSVRCGNGFANTKYSLLQMRPDYKSPVGQALIKSKTFQDLINIFDMDGIDSSTCASPAIDVEYIPDKRQWLA